MRELLRRLPLSALDVIEKSADTARVQPYARERYGKRERVKSHLRRYRTSKGVGALDPGKFTGFSGAAGRKGRFVVQDHKAERRGPHLDLRVDVGSGVATSFATRKLPERGEVVKVVAQPDHPISYMDYEGALSGYGQGTVTKRSDDPIEVHDASDDKLVFSIHGHRCSEDYALVHLGGRIWALRNFSPTDDEVKKYLSKIRYAQASIASLPFDDPDIVFTPKIDGAHGVAVLEGGRRPRVYSYRVGADGRPIEYTHKLQGLWKERVPGRGVSVVRCEVYAVDRDTGKAIPNEVLGGILNAGVWRSRELLNEANADVRLAMFNVAQYRDAPYLSRPFGEKLQAMEELKTVSSKFHMPLVARTAQEKRQLLHRLKRSQLAQTREGVVLERLSRFARPAKAKFRNPYDVVIREIFAGQKGLAGKGAGGFRYSATPKSRVLGEVGSGFTAAQRKEMHQHPERWIGRTAMVLSQSRYPSGALRAPAFQGLHWEKSQ